MGFFGLNGLIISATAGSVVFSLPQNMVDAAGALYAVWLIYAADIKYLLITLAFFITGIPVYFIAKKQK